MQYVNDDMDEVFRRAAEHYPLDTNSSNWDKVARALASPEDPQPEQPKKKNNRKQFKRKGEAKKQSCLPGHDHGATGDEQAGKNKKVK